MNKFKYRKIKDNVIEVSNDMRIVCYLGKYGNEWNLDCSEANGSVLNKHDLLEILNEINHLDYNSTKFVEMSGSFIEWIENEANNKIYRNVERRYVAGRIHLAKEILKDLGIEE